MASYVNLDTISRPSTGGTGLSAWGDQVNDNSAWQYGDTAWTTVGAFSNSWTAGATPPRFILSGRFVTMNGLITGGTITTTAFTLPVGYRPSGTVRVAVESNSAFAVLLINTTGAVEPYVGSTTNFAIDCTFCVL